MGDVVDFKPRPAPGDPVYQCDCGSQRFTLWADSFVSCAECDGEHQKLMWGMVFESRKQ